MQAGRYPAVGRVVLPRLQVGYWLSTQARVRRVPFRALLRLSAPLHCKKVRIPGVRFARIGVHAGQAGGRTQAVELGCESQPTAGVKKSMSALNWYADRTQVLLFTDTLVTDDLGNARNWTAKVFPIVHKRMLMASTGIHETGLSWWRLLNERMTARNVADLDEHAPNVLRHLWGSIAQQPDFSPDLTSTIYHFGFDDADVMRVFAYRSENGFESEEVGEGVRFKPSAGTTDFDPITDSIAFMEAQIAHQSTLPAGQRVYIGGEVLCYRLVQEGLVVRSIGRLGNFDRLNVSIPVWPQ